MNAPTTGPELLQELRAIATPTCGCPSWQHKCPRPQPSLRIPVTAANRERLRVLRAAEARAWEAGIFVSNSRKRD